MPTSGFKVQYGVSPLVFYSKHRHKHTVFKLEAWDGQPISLVVDEER